MTAAADDDGDDAAHDGVDNNDDYYYVDDNDESTWWETGVICEVTFGNEIFDKVQICDRLISIFCHLRNT